MPPAPVIQLLPDHVVNKIAGRRGGGAPGLGTQGAARERPGRRGHPDRSGGDQRGATPGGGHRRRRGDEPRPGPAERGTPRHQQDPRRGRHRTHRHPRFPGRGPGRPGLGLEVHLDLQSPRRGYGHRGLPFRRQAARRAGGGGSARHPGRGAQPVPQRAGAPQVPAHRPDRAGAPAAGLPGPRPGPPRRGHAPGGGRTRSVPACRRGDPGGPAAGAVRARGARRPARR